MRGRDIKRYSYEWAKIYLINFHNGYTCADGVKIPPLNIADFPSLKKHFDKFEPALSKRSDKGKTPYNLRNCAYLEEFEKALLVWKEVGKHFAFAITGNKEICDMTTSFISADYDILVYLQGLLLSNLIYWYVLKKSADKTGGGDLRLKPQGIVKIPIPKITKQNQNLALKISNLSQNLSEISQNFLNLKTEFLRELNLEKIPQKLTEFENLEFDEFIKEYAKAKKEKFTDKLAEVKFKNYYESFFSQYKSQVLSLKSQILRSENELNSLVYTLYDLSADEIALIENS